MEQSRRRLQGSLNQIRITETGVFSFDLDHVSREQPLTAAAFVVDQTIDLYESPQNEPNQESLRRRSYSKANKYIAYKLQMPEDESLEDLARMLAVATIVRGLPVLVAVDTRIAVRTDRQTEEAQRKIQREADQYGHGTALIVNAWSILQSQEERHFERLQNIKSTISELVDPVIDLELIPGKDSTMLDELEQPYGASVLLGNGIFVPSALEEEVEISDEEIQNATNIQI
jgi:hypothetical protein